ncbi:hypothetical protein Aperf_G00000131205 [Anoplocephala perfoliata]
MADASVGIFDHQKSNCDSVTSGFSSLHKSAHLDLQDDPNIRSLKSLLKDEEVRRTFQLFSRVIESRIPLGWIPDALFGSERHSSSGCEDVGTPDSSDDANYEPTTLHQPEEIRFSRIYLRVYHLPSVDFNSSPHLSSTISSKIQEIAIDLVNTFETRYAADYENLVDDALLVHNGVSAVNSSSSSEDTELDVTNPYRTDYTCLRTRYIKILESLFVSQINWGRIVAMISFLRALCVVLYTTPVTQSSLSSSEEVCEMTISSPQLAILHYLTWTTEFIHKESGLGDWIKAHGGWEGLEAFVNGGQSSIYKQFASIFVGASVLLFAPIGFASAIGFVLRRLWPRTLDSTQ